MALQMGKECGRYGALGRVAEGVLEFFCKGVGKIAQGSAEQRVQAGIIGKTVRHDGNLTVWPPADARWRTVRVGVPDT